MSVALMSMAMDSLGVPAVSLNAFQVAMHTTSAVSYTHLGENMRDAIYKMITDIVDSMTDMCFSDDMDSSCLLYTSPFSGTFIAYSELISEAI